jgi:hypothetical protein
MNSTDGNIVRENLPGVIQGWILQLETDTKLHELVELYEDRFIEIVLFSAYNNVVLQPEVRASKRSRDARR